MDQDRWIKAQSQMPSLPAMARGVMAVARRAATLARIWRRLPYTTKTLIGVFFDDFCLFSFSFGVVFCSCRWFSAVFSLFFHSEGSKRAKLDCQFLADYIQTRIALLSPPSPSQGEGWLFSILISSTSPLSKRRIEAENISFPTYFRSIRRNYILETLK